MIKTIYDWLLRQFTGTSRSMQTGDTYSVVDIIRIQLLQKQQEPLWEP